MGLDGGDGDRCSARGCKEPGRFIEDWVGDRGRGLDVPVELVPLDSVLM